MSEHLPILMVVIPLLTAPLLVLVKHATASRVIALIASAASAASAIAFAHGLTGPVSYHLGGWRPAIGIEYRIDPAGAYVAVLVSTIATIALLLGTRGTRDDVKGQEPFFYAAYMLCLAGLMGMIVTGDAFNIFVFLEISSLSTYTLVAMGRRRRALTAAYNYLILGTIGGTFVLIGIGLLYQMTGTLNGAAMAARVQELGRHPTIHVAFAFFSIGLAIKLAVFPLHQWLPSAYAESPHAVSAFLAGTATKVIYFQLIRVVVSFFGVSYVFGRLRFGELLLPLSVVAMFAGSLAAVYQPTLRRLLAYSSIGQVGYLTLALSLGTEAGLRAGLLHMGAHALTKTALFLVAAGFIARVGDDHIDALHGMGRRHPILSMAFVVGGIGLIGVPGTAGFVSKWALLEAALEAHRPFVAMLVLLSSLVAIAYVWRVVEALYLTDGDDAASTEDAETADDAPTYDWGTLVPAGLMLGLSIVWGIWSDFPTEYITMAARSLFAGGTP